MMTLIKSNAGLIAVRIQTITAGFDPDILSLPGGSFIAVFGWVYARFLAGWQRCSRSAINGS